MEVNCENREWHLLLPDILALIFKNLPLEEVLTVVPSVCKSWEAVVSGPYCWREINIVDWSENSDPLVVDRMIRLLVKRSAGSVRKLCVSHGVDESFDFIANNAQSLHTLKFHRSAINDGVVEASAPKLSSLTYLDLSYCVNLGAPALSALGKCCKALTTLRREMDPFGPTWRDDEALAIASTMRRLKHLDIQYLPVKTSSVMEILNVCKDLEFLDVRGCWDVVLERRLLLKEFPKLRVLGTVLGGADATGWDCSDAPSGFMAWDFEVDDDDGDDDDDDDDGDDGYDDVEEMYIYADDNVED